MGIVILTTRERSQLATILFTDIVDSTATLERVGDARVARAARRSQRRAARPDELVPRPREGDDR